MMGRAPCCDKNGLKKGPWTPEEDQKLIDYIKKHGYGNWRTLPKNAGLERCGKSCRLRWTNYLRPDIKRGKFSLEEEESIIQLHSILGNKWSAIAARLPGRTDNEIKNYWNTHIRKRLLRMGIDPVTHSPRLDLLDLSSIFNNTTFYNTNSSSSQMNMPRLLGMQPLVNPEVLKLATSLFNSNHQNPNSTLIHDLITSNPQLQSNFIPNLHSSQIQTPIRNPIPSCTTMTSNTVTTTATTAMTSTSPYCTSLPYFGEAQFEDPNFEQYPTTIPNLDNQNFDHWQISNGLVNIDEQASLSYYGYDQPFMDPSMSDNGQQSFMNFAPSVMSTPSSSPTHLNSNSNSTFVNSYGTEDEKESYCSNGIKFEIPDILDINQLLLCQSNC